VAGAENPTLWGEVRLHVWMKLAAGRPFTLGDPVLGKLGRGNVLGGTGDVGDIGQSLWVDVTCDVLNVTTHLGATQAEGVIARAEAGTCTLVLADPLRRYDPVASESPRLVPGVEVLVWAQHSLWLEPDFAAENAPVFMGRVETIAEPWTPHPSLRRCTIVASDATADLVASNRAALDTPVGAGELARDRVARILAAFAGPPLNEVTIRLDDPDLHVPAVPSVVVMQGTTMPGSAWAELNKVADAEVGFLYVQPVAPGPWSTDWQQQVQFLPRSTWSNTTDDPLTLPCGAVIGARVTASDAQQRTRVTGQRALMPGEEDIPANRVAHTRSRPAQRPLGYTRTDLELAEAEVLPWVEFVLATFAEPRVKVDMVSLRPGAAPGLWPGVLRTELAVDRVRLEWLPPDGGGEVTVTGRVVGEDHQISRASWTVDWFLADVILVASGFLLNEDLTDLLNEDGQPIRLS
jgi:hypothetical protein